MKRTLLTLATALSVGTAPTLAAAQAAPVPASETVEGSELRGGFLLPLAALVALLVAIRLLTDTDADDRDPESP